ncbi:MAG: hypothetical protein HPY62_08310, partial [Bacteroidales bacterium]|nr:hypothetical protein [Bacteroidales bacterium]
MIFLLSACEGRLPDVSTLPVTDITHATAISGGNIIDEGDAPVVSRGIIWGKNEPTLDSYSGMNSEGTGPGIFESLMTGLDQNTLYMVRAFASNKYGTEYGKVFKFTTSGKPPVNPGRATITTEWPTEITASSVKLNGNIISDGGSNITERGFYFGMSPEPEKEGSKLSAGSGTGFFSLSRSGLSVNTTYYYCAYAINSAGTSLGNVVYFSTNMTAFVNKVFNNSLTYGSLTD